MNMLGIIQVILILPYALYGLQIRDLIFFSGK